MALETGYDSGLWRLDMTLDSGDWIWLWTLETLDSRDRIRLWRLDMALETGYGSGDWI